MLNQRRVSSDKMEIRNAGWSSLVARRAHNPKVVGSNPAPATNIEGPGTAWAFVLCRADSVAQSLRHQISIVALRTPLRTRLAVVVTKSFELPIFPFTDNGNKAIMGQDKGATWDHD